MPDKPAQPGVPRRAWAEIAVLLLLGFVTFGWSLAARPLYNHDETRYAEIAREMWDTGDWIVPRIDGIPDLDKPPLQMWLTAPLIGLFGPRQLAPRLVPCAAAFALLFLLRAAGRRMFGPGAGFWAGVVWATSMLPVGLARGATLDMLLTALTTGAILCFWRALDGTEGGDTSGADGHPHALPEREARRRGGAPSARASTGCCALLGWALAGLAFVAKGPIGFVLPAAAGVAWFLAHRTFPWRRLDPWGGVAVCLAVAAPWYAAVEAAEPAFLSRFFLHENMAGFLSGQVHHSGPPWIPWLYLLAGAFPWIFLLLPAAARDRALWREPRARFLALWALGVMAFFTLSAAKLFTYQLPALPPLALLAGAVIARARPAAANALPAWGLGMIAAAAAVLLLSGGVLPAHFAALRLGPGGAACAGLLAAGMAVVGWLAWKRGPRPAALATAVLVAALVHLSTPAARRACDGALSARTLIRHHPDLLGRPDLVVMGDEDYSVIYYTRRPVTFVSPHELDFGARLEASGRVLWTPAALAGFLRAHPGAAVIVYHNRRAEAGLAGLDLECVDRVGECALFLPGRRG